jgi:protein-disulfide isomerase
MNRTILVAALAAIAVTIGAYVYLSPPDQATSLLPVSAANAQDTVEATDVDTSAIIEMTLGDPEAPITVIEYASFTCPHCRSFHETVFPQLEENFIDTGLVQFIYREVYFDRYGLWAGMIARCAGPVRYFGVVDLLYENQSEWTVGDPATVAENLSRIGLTVGLTRDQVDACLQDGDTAQALVSWYEENAATDDVTGTPSFIINGEKYSNMSYASFAETLNALLPDSQ